MKSSSISPPFGKLVNLLYTAGPEKSSLLYKPPTAEKETPTATDPMKYRKEGGQVSTFNTQIPRYGVKRPLHLSMLVGVPLKPSARLADCTPRHPKMLPNLIETHSAP